MHDGWLFAGAVVCIYVGFAWLALAMDAHWVQAQGPQPARPPSPNFLRGLGTAALLLSLVLCLLADTAAIAPLVWAMALAAGACAVAFTLTWRPRWLRIFAVRNIVSLHFQ
ncbi:MAG: DUF3325 domain-containing protein [Burkholderiaceae bacterium]